MNLNNLKKIIIADATGQHLKLALCQDCKVVKKSTVQGQALECFFQALNEICNTQTLAEVDAFFLCTGTGSILGTRTASVGLSTISKFTNAKIFEYNCMEVASYALAQKGENKFSLFTPSRKGFVNILNFNSKIELLKEIKIDEIQSLAFEKKISLYQRDKTDAVFAQMQQFKISEEEIASTLFKHPELITLCTETPDAKSLTEREYVKWKAQAHI